MFPKFQETAMKQIKTKIVIWLLFDIQFVHSG